MLDAALIAGMKMAAINELPTWFKILDITSLHAGVTGCNTKAPEYFITSGPLDLQSYYWPCLGQ